MRRASYWKPAKDAGIGRPPVRYRGAGPSGLHESPSRGMCMSRTPFMMLAATALLWPAPAPAPPTDEGLAFRAVRYYRADANKTLVKAFVQVPYAMLTPGGTGPQAVMTYQFTARVVDANGM